MRASCTQWAPSTTPRPPPHHRHRNRCRCGEGCVRRWSSAPAGGSFHAKAALAVRLLVGGLRVRREVGCGAAVAIEGQRTMHCQTHAGNQAFPLGVGDQRRQLRSKEWGVPRGRRSSLWGRGSGEGGGGEADCPVTC